jgi:hypothetical protein
MPVGAAVRRWYRRFYAVQRACDVLEARASDVKSGLHFWDRSEAHSLRRRIVLCGNLSPLFADAALRVTGVALRVADADLRFRNVRQQWKMRRTYPRSFTPTLTGCASFRALDQPRGSIGTVTDWMMPNEHGPPRGFSSRACDIQVIRTLPTARP